tara:strand:- start:4567 stop:5442 length:876 start_codon:yes stop_codon:yes gene_type:complete
MASDFRLASDRRTAIAKAMRFETAPRIMGIVNATPDSFYEGSRSMDEEAVRRGLSMWDDGATWVDVGGESTRPGAEPVGIELELARVLPVIRGLRAARPSGFISIDTRHAAVAQAAVEAGADMVNDVSGLRNPKMRDVVVNTGCGVCIMHMQGEPGTMQTNPSYNDVVEEVRSSLEEMKQTLSKRGHPLPLILIDPGIGFGKTQAHNIALLNEGRGLVKTEGALLWGVSRKSIVGHLTGQSDPAKRLPGTLGLAAVAHQMNIDIVRVHDVVEHRDLFEAMSLGSAQSKHIE